ncbi:hypothetical protein DdX_11953 [Ditylenchus destructor]|uniref:Uncharacterized protein n=1 Tax=Ditylenchus destructor TaxID=166010 RepID=A0AAD4MXA0_9BILA|nr:hypothetical protein DdX_11953 [Ditylenchus destructor]
MGNGEIVTDENEYIEIPKHCIVKEDLVEEIFGKLVDEKNYDEMSKRVILTTTNDRALKTNVEKKRRNVNSAGQDILQDEKTTVGQKLPPHGNQKPKNWGKPLSWKQQITEIAGKEWMKIAQDRVKWRSIVNGQPPHQKLATRASG